MRSAYQKKLDTDAEPLFLRLAEDMRDLVQWMRASEHKRWRSLVDNWMKREPAKAALVLDEVATFLVDLLKAAEAAKPKTKRCDACGGTGTTTEAP